MIEVEVNMLGKYARGCKAAGIEIFELLTAVGIKESHTSSKFKEFRVMGKKYKTVLEVEFEKLAVFKPGMIVGNSHTPRWLTIFTSLIPDSFGWGNIHQKEIAKAFVAHLEKGVAIQNNPVVSGLGILLRAIQGTTNSFRTTVKDVSVNHGGLDVFVTK